MSEQVVHNITKSDANPESEFYEIDEHDTYASVGNISIEANTKDFDYPVSISAETEDGRDIGVVLTRNDLRRLAMEAWFARVI